MKKRIIALFISLCISTAFVPSVAAASLTGDPQDVDSAELIIPVDKTTTQAAESTTQAVLSTTQTPESTTQTPESTTNSEIVTTQTTVSGQLYTKTAANSGRGFENVETDGGVLFVGTARTPKDDGSISTVKFVYSSSLNLNDKSLALVNKELAACGVTIPNGMIYVSESDVVSDSQLMTSTSERQAVFAVGSPSAPTVLMPCRAYGSVEESFERLFPGYIFSISGYTSLRPLLDGREEVTLSEDGQTASTSIVMSEDYVEKVINGKKIKILMINSELKYYFRAPKLVFEKDEDYNVSDSDIIYHYPTRSTTDPSDTLTKATTQSTGVTNATEPDDTSSQSTTESVDVTDPITVRTEPTQTTIFSESTTSTDVTDPFWEDDTTTTASTTSATTVEDDWQTTSTNSTRSNPTHTDPSRLIPYAQPIEPRSSQTTTEELPPVTLPTMTTTEPTTNSTTEPTNEIPATLPTATQPTKRQEPILDPFNQREQHSVGEAYVNTRRLPLNIRTGPGLNYMVISILPKGTHLTVLDTSSPDWYMVRLRNGSVGYAYSYYIKFV